MARQYFDALDLTILHALTANARTPYLNIAREYGVSGAAVHQRVQRLVANNVITGSHCDINPESVGFTVVAYLGVNVLPGTNVDELAAQVAEIPEITECHIVTGRFDLIIKLQARDNADMLRVIRDELHHLSIASTETMVSFREAFSRSVPIANE